jgi:hypothetical protein
MKRNVRMFIVLAAFAALIATTPAFAQGTAFTYEGQLQNNGSPANGLYDFQFSLSNAPSGGSQVGGTVTKLAVGVTNGLFTTSLDFGSVFTGNATWLAISVRTNNPANTLAYVPLTPLQALTPTPYAIFANTSSNLSGTVSATQLNGAVGNGQLANNSVTVNAGTGLSGGGAVALGASTTLNNAGVTALAGGGGVTVSASSGSVTLGSTATSANTANAIVSRDGSGDFSAGSVTLDGSLNLPAYYPVIYSGSALVLRGDYYGNFFIGSGAGNLTLSGQANTAIGDGALASVTSGFYNTANGNGALGNNTSGSDNIALGYLAGLYISTGSGNIDIGNQGSSTDTNIIRIGSAQSQTFIAGVINGNGAGLTNLSASQLSSGTLPLAQLPGAVITNNAAGVTLNGTLNGNGSGLTGLNASQLTSGVVPTSVLPGFQSPYDTIGGGQGNTASGGYATVGGGYSNTDASIWSTIGGGNINVIQAAGQDSTISGGAGNTISNNNSASVISGGSANTIGAGVANGFIGGGYQNTNTGSMSVIGGGNLNSVQNAAQYATVGGGVSNTAGGAAGTVGGGQGNTASGSYAAVGGGAYNIVQTSGNYGFIGGGAYNTNSGGYATVGGGVVNNAIGPAAIVGGGQGNTASASYATVAGGFGNTASAKGAFIGGGGYDGGYAGNLAQALGAAIGGGVGNNILSGGTDGFIGGGSGNSIASSPYATIGGGAGNVIGVSSDESFIGGGNNNTILAKTFVGFADDTIAGGLNNTIGSAAGIATIGGGEANTNNGVQATISGGSQNECSGETAAIPGGYRNVADGNYSFAAGQQAEAMHEGAFVWADSATVSTPPPPFTSVANNEFAVRATGGVRLVTAINISGTPSAGVTLAAGSGTWGSLSDRNAKDNFAPVTPQQVLAKVAELPITKWSYKTEQGVRHVGPMAQDFYAAFEVGEDNKHITTVDEEGVALAAIQGLNQKLNEKDGEIQDLKARLEKLEQLMAEQTGGAK